MSMILNHTRFCDPTQIHQYFPRLFFDEYNDVKQISRIGYQELRQVHIVPKCLYVDQREFRLQVANAPASTIEQPAETPQIELPPQAERPTVVTERLD